MHEDAQEPALISQFGLLDSALSMEFTTHFDGDGGACAVVAAAEALARVIEAPEGFLEPVLAAGDAVGRTLLSRSEATQCRLVLSADPSGITLAATDDAEVSLDSAERPTALKEAARARTDDELRVHRGPDGHLWVVWRRGWEAVPGT
ncbi:hypothetical protein [Streptomyces sp. NPDC059009]|uniref:hypothetical protein n=1 Tax=Streptomyces sp. NPDC059009 TaxID=3346694 RepID=UPI0036860411